MLNRKGFEYVLVVDLLCTKSVFLVVYAIQTILGKIMDQKAVFPLGIVRLGEAKADIYSFRAR